MTYLMQSVRAFWSVQKYMSWNLHFYYDYCQMLGVGFILPKITDI